MKGSQLAMGDHQIDGIYLTPKRKAKLEFREAILDSWRRRCAYCGCSAGTLDHVHPRARGGHSVRRNLIAACAPCNRAKGSEDWLAWFRQQTSWTPWREAEILSWLGEEHHLAA